MPFCPKSFALRLFSSHRNLKNPDNSSPNHDAVTKPRILISGGGLGGVALATALLKYGIHAHILEKDQTLHTRNQGFNLTCQRSDYVWSRLGLTKAINTYDCSTNQYFSYRSDGSIIQQFELPPVWCMPREVLRTTMLNQLSIDNISCGTTIQSFKDDQQGITVALSDGSVSRYDLLIAADGIHSPIRTSIVPNKPLHYLGVIIILGTCDSDDPITRNRFQMMDGNTRLFCKPWNDSRVFWQITFPCALEECEKFGRGGGDGSSGSVLLDEVIHRMSGWYEPLRNLIAKTNPQSVYASPLYDRDPFEPELLSSSSSSSSSSSHIALIGDAAHPMSPFRGEGANNALMDGVLLADMIGQYYTESVKNSFKAKSISTAMSDIVRKFHIEMMERARPKVEESRRAVEITHHPMSIDKQYLDSVWDYTTKIRKLI